jgi:hypothetical protein
MDNFDKLKTKALNLGATSFGLSSKKNKKYVVVYEGKKIDFGSSNGKTYIDHNDDKKRKAWIARHSMIFNKDVDRVIDLDTSPSYWSKRLLWDKLY